MISITCTNCQSSLSIDDAFAGGVCRCQHCGTIQTVPSKKPGAAAAAVKTPKTLYQKRAREVSSTGTGLDELAEVVTSSGLSGSSGLRSVRPPGALAPGQAQRNSLTTLLGIAAIVVIALLLVILVVVTRRDVTATAGRPTGTSGGGGGGANITGGGGSTPAPAVDPTFCGIKLDHPSVVYLLDRGSSTQSPFGSLKEATFKSIASLGLRRRFQIVFWDNGQDAGTFPAVMAFASPKNLEDVRKSTEDVYAFGATDAAPALARAMSQRPAAIVIATGKGADLDERFVQMVNDTKKDVPVVIHTIAIGGSGQSTALKTIAASTGGEYRELTEGELNKLAQ